MASRPACETNTSYGLPGASGCSEISTRVGPTPVVSITCRSRYTTNATPPRQEQHAPTRQHPIGRSASDAADRHDDEHHDHRVPQQAGGPRGEQGPVRAWSIGKR